ncbi:hypothetical protein EVAR_12167_1 [Eumeta japonica]|uniref:Uncharacterized protein n=1 Tax=Eumeta variegata TaxID=151549 RepID=A0A4C1UHA0_EUMVA|nr:hypothetical protein EVAR_12167_1 [Eumeta japonica]
MLIGEFEGGRSWGSQPAGLGLSLTIVFELEPVLTERCTCDPLLALRLDRLSFMLTPISQRIRQKPLILLMADVITRCGKYFLTQPDKLSVTLIILDRRFEMVLFNSSGL